MAAGPAGPIERGAAPLAEAALAVEAIEEPPVVPRMDEIDGTVIHPVVSDQALLDVGRERPSPGRQHVGNRLHDLGIQPLVVGGEPLDLGQRGVQALMLRREHRLRRHRAHRRVRAQRGLDGR